METYRIAARQVDVSVVVSVLAVNKQRAYKRVDACVRRVVDLEERRDVIVAAARVDLCVAACRLHDHTAK